MAYANRIESSPGLPGERAPKRITITLAYGVFTLLEQRSAAEGRSLSNLAAYLLERGLADRDS